MDLGYLGPGLRIIPGISYWSSTMKEGEVAELETKIRDLVFDPFSSVAPPSAYKSGNSTFSTAVVLGSR